MKMREVCNREVVVVGREGSNPEAARLMRQYRVGDVVVAEESGEVMSVLQRMRGRGVQRGPVVRAGGSQVGILAVDDLMVEQLSDLVKRIGNEQHRELRRRE